MFRFSSSLFPVSTTKVSPGLIVCKRAGAGRESGCNKSTRRTALVCKAMTVHLLNDVRIVILPFVRIVTVCGFIWGCDSSSGRQCVFVHHLIHTGNKPALQPGVHLKSELIK